MTLYVDIIFMENVFMNSIILLATGIILKDSMKIVRNLIGSTIGALYAIIIYVSNIAIYSNIILKILLSFVIVYISFKPANPKSFFKHVVIFYLTSFTFGGVAFALLYFVRPEDILYQNGVLIGTYPIKMILAGGILGFIIITIAFKNIKSKLSKQDMFCDVKLKLEEKTLSFKAIIDTGNFLRDPISKAPVIIVEKKTLKGFLPAEIVDNTHDIINGKNVELGAFSQRIRAIPFKSLGKENGLILGFKLNNARIEYQDIEYKAKNVIIGIYNGKLSRSGKYNALVGLDILNE